MKMPHKNSRHHLMYLTNHQTNYSNRAKLHISSSMSVSVSTSMLHKSTDRVWWKSLFPSFWMCTHLMKSFCIHTEKESAANSADKLNHFNKNRRIMWERERAQFSMARNFTKLFWIEMKRCVLQAAANNISFINDMAFKKFA